MKNLKSNIITKIALVVFLLLSINIYSQKIQRIILVDNGKLIIRKAPSEPITLYTVEKNGDTSDVKMLSIYQDSINKEFKLMLLFNPNKIKLYNVKIGFVNGEQIIFRAKASNSQYNYKNSVIIYDINNEDLHKLTKNKFDYLEFISDGLIEPCVSIKTKSFFVNFINRL